MSALSTIRTVLDFLFRRQRAEREMEEELRSHLRSRADDLERQGIPRAEAERQARIEFGGYQRHKEECREALGTRLLGELIADVRFGLRQLHRNPGFTAVAIITLALGIGANTAIFSLMDAVMLRALPVRNPQQLVLLNWKEWRGETTTDILAVRSDNGSANAAPFSYPTFEELLAHSHAFSSLFGFVSLGKAEIGIRGQAQLAQGEMVTGEYFSGLGVSPILGRVITEVDENPGASHAAVISYGYWSREFGRSRKVLGKSITVDGVPFTVIGVAPPEFLGVQPGRGVDVWVPLINNPKLLPFGIGSTPGGRSLFTSRDWWWLLIMARLKPGVAAQQAGAEVNELFRESITAGLKTPPKPRSIPHIRLEPASDGLALLRQQFSKPLWILTILVGLVLLIACANVGGLLLARSAVRQKEIAVRLSLGGSRLRLIRQLLTESTLLGCCGGALGLLFAYWGSHALLLLMSSGRQPLYLQVQMDARVLAFTAGVSLLVGVLFGLAPAWRATRVELTLSLKTGPGSGSAVSQRTRLGLGKALVALQVTLSLVLLIGTGLFVRTLENLEHENLGFNQHHLLLFAMDPTTHGYKGARLVEFYEQLLRRLQAMPGASSATMSEMTLISGRRARWPIAIEGYKAGHGQSLGVNFNEVGPSFFKTMEIGLLLGRGIRWQDTTNSPKVAVVNQAFARRFLGGASPLGHSFRFGYYHFKPGQFSPAYQIVGLARDARYNSLRNAPPPTVYVSYSQAPFPLGGIHFEVRTRADPLALVPAVRRAVHDLDPDLPIAEVKTQTEQIGSALVQERLFARLSSFFGGLAVLLACIGLYGLMAYVVARRMNEIGVRMALGAQKRDVLRLVLGQGMTLALIGVAAGIVAAAGLTRFLSSLLFGVKPTDPVTFVAVLLILIGVALLACYIPARRAAKVDPAVALRHE